MILYLSGPMRGRNDYNFKTFYVAEALLEMKGHKVLSPARLDIDEGQAHWNKAEGRIIVDSEFTMKKALRRDFLVMCQGCEGIVLLPGWPDSEGAKAELELARLIGMEEFEYMGDGEFVELDKSMEVS